MGRKLEEDTFDAIKLLQDAHNAGLRIEVVGVDGLKIKGPETASAIVHQIIEHKMDVIKLLNDSPDLAPQIEELKSRLRKGIDWFVAVDPQLWDENNYPINQNTKLELKLTRSITKWHELERLLRNLYDYEGCIYSGVDMRDLDGSCPEASPVKCGGCE